MSLDTKNSKLLIANRGEIAIRIARAAAELGIPSVAIHTRDDARSLHVAKATESRLLQGSGVAPYLDIAQIVDLAQDAGCTLLHPGYGFLSENAAFARRCTEAGIVFIGPDPDVLELFGDKVRARALAERCAVPVTRGSATAVDLSQARVFFDALPNNSAMLIKAVAGGGGRGMRAVFAAQEIDAAFARCQSEARTAFGNDMVYVEEMLPRARHIEVQIVGDAQGRVVALGERECSLQRRHQKLVEIAPSPSLTPVLRARIVAAAVQMAEAVRYSTLGTFEFLVRDDDGMPSDGSPPDGSPPDDFVFIEANPRLQVEHTVTEAVTGVDLVQTQIQLALGADLATLGLVDVPAPRGYAVQLRINMETVDAAGNAMPAGGLLAAFEAPGGPGVRVDTFGYAGYRTSADFDSLLAKLIVHVPGPDYAAAVDKAYRALSEFRIEGVDTNTGFLLDLLALPAVRANRVYTRFIEQEYAQALRESARSHRPLFFADAEAAQQASDMQQKAIATPPGTQPVIAPMQARVVGVDVEAGTRVTRGQVLLVLEAMKMEHAIVAPCSGRVRLVAARVGDIAGNGQPLLFIEVDVHAEQDDSAIVEIDLHHIRPDLEEVLQRHRIGLDDARAAAVARRRKTGGRTARENVADLCDDDSFIEYGALVVASQRHRRSLDELIDISPADGMVCGIGSVNGETFGAEAARCAVLAYDYTVFAGTQGYMNHKKKDRLFQLAEQWRLPIVAFAEGGGGRPGDDWTSPSALETDTFASFARLSGLVPLVGITAGRCFAGNAALLGCCDVIIATRNSNIGMGGPAMIEGGGLGVYKPEDVGPVAVQAPNGVIDIVVDDEAQAVAVAKKYLAYFQGPLAQWECADQRLLRQAIPENRVRVYDIRELIATLADTGSVLELRAQFGIGMITAFIRIEGRPLGVIANNPLHLGGAIDADAADKAARFLQLCDAFDIPILSLCDTPGFMVGPEVEKTAQVRHVSRMFVVGGNIRVPLFAIVLRKGYGLGVQAMTGGSFHAPLFTVAWPTGEFGAMGLEGAVRLGFRKELEAIADPAEREALFQRMVADAYCEGKGLNAASYFELDDVIDPMESRRWLVRGLKSLPAVERREHKKRPFIDTW
jgi:acetyl/propionyl-CoA carboxylase alpha subunit/acetyl-CoA carboxylase carboxyltransferase component